MTGRTIAAMTAAAVLAVAVTAGVAASSSADDAPTSDGRSDATGRSTVAVERRDLVEREELDGTLGFGPSSDVALPGAGPGTITALPAEGSTVERGGVLAEVDGRAVRLLFGARPMWRDLGPDVGDGPDVRQLEENLVALGHATASSLAVDDDWTDATTAAVKRWQQAMGVDQTGVVALRDLVVLAGAVRVADHRATVGGPAGGGPILSVTGTTKVVSVDLDASRRDLLPVGTAVEVDLPGGGSVDGTVLHVASVVTPPAEQTPGARPTVEVTIALAAAAEAEGAGAFDAAPVDVQVAVERVAGALAVPVEALLALADGGYVVERVRGASSELVPVEVGASADGFVEVTGAIEEGDRVVVAR